MLTQFLMYQACPSNLDLAQANYFVCDPAVSAMAVFDNMPVHEFLDEFNPKEVLDHLMHIPIDSENAKKMAIESFRRAARDGDVQSLVELLPVVRAKGYLADILHAIHFAATNGRLEVFQILLEIPAVLEHLKRNGAGLVASVAQSGNIDLLNYYLKTAELEDKASVNYNNALSWAVSIKNKAVIERLLSIDCVLLDLLKDRSAQLLHIAKRHPALIDYVAPLIRVGDESLENFLKDFPEDVKFDTVVILQDVFEPMDVSHNSNRNKIKP